LKGGRHVLFKTTNFSNGWYLDGCRIAHYGSTSDRLQIINPSLESFETGIKLRNVNGVRVTGRIEITGPSYHFGTAISIDGSPLTSTGPSRANMTMGSVIGGSAVGIQLGAGAKSTQIIGNSIVDTLAQINVDSGANGTLILDGELFGSTVETGGARWTSGVGFPYSGIPCSNGSLYTRTDTVNVGDGVLYA
jgi:nitrous oxidase accessory protein NosD